MRKLDENRKIATVAGKSLSINTADREKKILFPSVYPAKDVIHRHKYAIVPMPALQINPIHPFNSSTPSSKSGYLPDEKFQKTKIVPVSLREMWSPNLLLGRQNSERNATVYSTVCCGFPYMPTPTEFRRS
ncbi:MAG: hypothetical protein LBD59_03765 [Prevotellaceae bacterium]|jgi:hypothetical protein|nr:hypothetical protein [Prevotellaceae bacterium]